MGSTFFRKLPTPMEIKTMYPVPEAVAEQKKKNDAEIRDIFTPVCTGGGELRMSVKVPGEDWWRTEFAIPNGKIVFRENKSVIDSWSEIGPEYAINVKAGQKINLNFVQKTGSVTQ